MENGKWEYLTLSSKSIDELNEMMNAAGEDGWEAFSYLIAPSMNEEKDDQPVLYIYCVLKRQFAEDCDECDCDCDECKDDDEKKTN